jgi:hypothetical protein
VEPRDSALRNTDTSNCRGVWCAMPAAAGGAMPGDERASHRPRRLGCATGAGDDGLDARCVTADGGRQRNQLRHVTGIGAGEGLSPATAAHPTGCLRSSSHSSTYQHCATGVMVKHVVASPTISRRLFGRGAVGFPPRIERGDRNGFLFRILPLQWAGFLSRAAPDRGYGVARGLPDLPRDGVPRNSRSGSRSDGARCCANVRSHASTGSGGVEVVEAVTVVVRHVFAGAKQRLGEGIVVAGPRRAIARDDAEREEPLEQSGAHQGTARCRRAGLAGDRPSSRRSRRALCRTGQGVPRLCGTPSIPRYCG